MPMLEEMNYVPTTRYAFGDEIRRHLDAIAHEVRPGRRRAVPHRRREERVGREQRRWVIRTDRGDEVRARYLVMAVGILNLMKLPVIPGMDDFEGTSFHSARWDYEYTGGAPDDPADKLGRQGRRRRRVGRERDPGAPAAGGVGEARVRVPAHAVGDRGARQPPDRRRLRRAPPARLAAGADGELQRGHDRAAGRRDLVDDGWTLPHAAAQQPGRRTGDDAGRHRAEVEEFDYEVMEEHRRAHRGARRRPGRRRDAQAVLPLRVQAAAASTTSTSPRSTTPT